MKHLKFYSFLFVFFFGIGFAWGKYFYFSNQQPLEIFSQRKLKIILPSQILTDDVIESFHLQYQAELIVDTYDVRDSLEIIISKKQPYDLILAFEPLSRKMIQSELVMPLHSKKLKNKDQVSPDFRLNYDQDLEFMIPFFWGVENKKTQQIVDSPIKKQNTPQRIISSEVNELWILNFLVSRQTQNYNLALSFLDFLMQSEILLEVSKSAQLASTFRALDDHPSIDEKLKPKHLRTFKLTSLKLSQ